MKAENMTTRQLVTEQDRPWKRISLTGEYQQVQLMKPIATTPQWRETAKRTAYSFRTPERPSSSSSKLMQRIQGPILQQHQLQSQGLKCFSSSSSNRQQHKRTVSEVTQTKKQLPLPHQQSYNENESKKGQDKIVIADLIREVTTTASVCCESQMVRQEEESKQPQKQSSQQCQETGADPKQETIPSQAAQTCSNFTTIEVGSGGKPASEIESTLPQQIKLKQFEPILLTNRSLYSKSPAHLRTPSRLSSSNIGSTTTPAATRGCHHKPGKPATSQWNVNTLGLKNGPAVSSSAVKLDNFMRGQMTIETDDSGDERDSTEQRQQNTRSISDLNDLAIKIGGPSQGDKNLKKGPQNRQSLTTQNKLAESKIKQAPSSTKPQTATALSSSSRKLPSSGSKSKLVGKKTNSNKVVQTARTAAAVQNSTTYSRYSAPLKKGQRHEVDSLDAEARKMVINDQQVQLERLEPALIQIDSEHQVPSTERAKAQLSKTTAEVEYANVVEDGENLIGHSASAAQMLPSGPKSSSLSKVGQSEDQSSFNTIERVEEKASHRGEQPVSTFQSKADQDQDSAQPALIQQRAQSSLQNEPNITLEELYCAASNLLKSPSMPTLKPIAETLPMTPNRLSFMRPTISSQIKKEISMTTLSQKKRRKNEEQELDQATSFVANHSKQGNNCLVHGVSYRESTPSQFRGRPAPTRDRTPRRAQSSTGQAACCAVAPKTTMQKNETRNINKQQRGSCTTLLNQHQPQDNPALLTLDSKNHSPKSAATTMRHNQVLNDPSNSSNQRAHLHNMIISSASGTSGGQSQLASSSIRKAALIYENPTDILVHHQHHSRQHPNKVSIMQSPQKSSAHQLTGNYYHQVLKGGTQMHQKTAKAAIKRQKQKQYMQVRGGQPPFVGTVTKQTAGQISMKTQDVDSDMNEVDSKIVGGNIHLQDILDEVNHIEQTYALPQNQKPPSYSTNDHESRQKQLKLGATATGLHSRDSRDSLKNAMETQQFVIHNCKQGSSLNPYKVSQTAQYKAHVNMAGRIFTDSTVSGQQQLQRKGATQTSWHRHQNSMKSTQTTVTSPRKQSVQRQRNGQLKQKSDNAHHSNVYGSKGGSGGGLGNMQQRKSLNFPSKSITRKNTLLSSTDDNTVVDIAPTGHHQRGVTGSEFISQHEQVTPSMIKLDKGGRSEAFHRGYTAEEKRSGRTAPPETANSGKNFTSYRVSNLSNEATRMIKTDHDHFGTFMISVNKRNQIESTGGLIDSKNGGGYSSAGDPTSNHADMGPSIDTRLGSLVQQEHPSGSLIGSTREVPRLINPSDANNASDSPIRVYSYREHDPTDGVQAPIASESNMAALKEIDQVPLPESCLSPEIPSMATKKVAVIYNKDSTDSAHQSALLQDIQRGQKKLGRALKCDSVLGLVSYTKCSTSNLDNIAQMATAMEAQNQSQTTSVLTGANRTYVPLDKRGSLAVTKNGSFNASRASKSPMPTKKGSAQDPKTNQQKQSLKKLGLSYGLVMKQDGQILQPQVTKPIKKRLPGSSKDQISPKKPNKQKSQTHVEDIYKINAPLDSQELAVEARQVTYDEQTTLSPMQSATIAINKARYVAKSHSRITSSEIAKGMNQTVTSPARFNQSVKKQPQTQPPHLLQQMAHNQLIMKRMPELLIAPTVSSLNSVQNHFLPQTQRGRLFKYQVFSGNNQQLVRRVMHETRSYLWTEMQNTQQSHFHFRWAPVSRQVNFDRLSHNFGQIVNHFEHHHEVTTKNELFKNLKAFHDEKNQNVFHTIPLTFYLKVSADRQAQSIKQQIKPFKEVFNLLEEFKDQFNPEIPEVQEQTQPQKQQDEETPGTTPATCHEKSMDNCSSITKVETMRDYDKLCTTALSVLVTKKGQEMGYRDFKSNAQGELHARVKKFTSKSSGLTMPMSHFAGQNIWILKPTGFNRGKGIHVVNSISKLKKLIKEYSRSKETVVPVANSTVYPTSKFMEPQALNTQQLMNVTLQAAAQNNQPAPFNNFSLSTTKHSRQNLTNSQLPRFIKAGDALPGTADSQGKSPKKVGAKKAGSKLLSSAEKLASEKVDEAAPSPTVKTAGVPETETMTTISEKEANQATGQDTTQLPVKPQTVLMKEKTTEATKDQSAASGSKPGYQKPQIRSQAFIIQKYVERPLLINKRKFDIRVWVTVTQDNEIYFFKEGYLRTSSQPYNMTAQNLDNDFIHLTNNAVQINSPEYGSHEDGNQLSFADFQKLLVKGGAPVNFETDIVTKMKFQCAQTLVSIRKKLNPNRRKHCFELFGFDFFIDVDYNIWLIEVNTNPCLVESSKILETLLPRMLDDLFKLTIDQIFLPTKDLMQQIAPSVNQISHGKTGTEKQYYNLQTGKSQYKVAGYKDSCTMWERIGTMKQNVANPIYIPNPYDRQVSRSDKIIHLVNQMELRVAKPDLIEKGIKRDKLQSGTSQLASFADY